MVFLKISQNSQENTCARVNILMKLQAWGLQLYQKKTLVQLFSYEHLFCKTPPENCFCMLRVVLQKWNQSKRDPVTSYQTVWNDFNYENTSCLFLNFLSMSTLVWLHGEATTQSQIIFKMSFSLRLSIWWFCEPLLVWLFH